MSYVSKWESLSAACEQMTAAGLAKDEAKNDIGQMVADRVVEIRVTLREHATNGMRSSDVLYAKGPRDPNDYKTGRHRLGPFTASEAVVRQTRGIFATRILAHREN
jgi:hypothetical protein